MPKYHYRSLVFRPFIKVLEFINKKKKTNFLTRIIRMIKTTIGKVIYIIEDNWSIQWDGIYITENLTKTNLIRAEIGSYKFSRKKIIQFGDIGCYILSNNLIQVHKSNKAVLTWFHVEPGDYRLRLIPLINKRIDLLHVSSDITKQTLIDHGFPEEKIVKVPLGVDLSIFKNYVEQKKKF